ncbi:uncharacterized protein [Pseudorca crassidens]|uniref:uncharacterized protein n=1 Tax=Pseudorca crassidens TaxID=82174 RepID=UPI00352DB1CE
MSEPQWWKNKGLLGSQSTGRRVTRLAGKPKQPRWAKSRKEGSDARASRRCPRAPTLLPRRLARRASASKIPAPSQPRPPRPLSLPLGRRLPERGRFWPRGARPRRPSLRDPAAWEEAKPRPPCPKTRGRRLLIPRSARGWRRPWARESSRALGGQRSAASPSSLAAVGDCLAAVGAPAAQPPVARSRSLWWWRRRLRERQRVHAVRGCGPVLVPWLPRPGGRRAADCRHPLGTLLRGAGVRGWGGWLGPASGPDSRVGVPERRSVSLCARRWAPEARVISTEQQPCARLCVKNKMATFRLGFLAEVSLTAAHMTLQDNSFLVVQFLEDVLPSSHSSPPLLP